MNDLEGTKHSGRFLVEDRWLEGDLDCRGPDTTLRLHDDVRFELADGAVITGRLSNRVSVTLIGCVPPADLSTAGVAGRFYYYADVFVHYVVTGARDFAADAAAVRRLAFVTGDTDIIFHDRGVFGTISGKARDEIFEKLATESARPIEIGEQASLMYFTGKTDICTVETILGVLAAHHRPRSRVESISGVGISNQVIVTLTPYEARCFDDALNDLLVFLRFFGQLTGRQQSPTELFIEATEGAAASDEWLRVHWSLRPEPVPAAFHLQPMDLPLQAAKDPSAFGKVLAEWVTREAAWRTPRTRLDRVWSHRRGYDVDRLVSAANMFDILPDDAAPKKVPLTSDLKAVKQQIHKLVAPLPPSIEKDSLLGAVGRLGNANLKSKLRHCAAKLPQTVLDRLPELPQVLDEAVNCRNHFVHGSGRRLDYDDGALVTFFTDSLEFVFVAYDLALAGWSPARSFVGRHPFQTFVAGYDQRLAELRRHLSLD